MIDFKLKCGNKSSAPGTILKLAMKDVAIRRWMLLGPLDRQNVRKVFNHTFTAEQEMNPQNQYPGLDGLVQWTDCTILNGNYVLDLSELVGIQKGSVVLAATYVYSRKSRNAVLLTKSIADRLLSVNGVAIDQINGSDETVQTAISLNHGWNFVQLKLENAEGGEWSFYGGLTSELGEPFKDGWVKTCFMHNGDCDTQLFGKNPTDQNQNFIIGRIEEEYKHSNPDFVVYIPREGDEHNDGDNEHFLVFESPKRKELLAMWTQGSMEPSGDNHIVLARSKDRVNWSGPQWLIGTHKGTQETQASWGFPIVAGKTGRIYCFYTKSAAGVLGGSGGVMGVLRSDDGGIVWVEDNDIRLPDCFDNQGNEIGSFIVWQKAIRDSKGRQILGYTHTDKQKHCTCKFFRFENIDEGPGSKDIEITLLQKEMSGIGLPENVGRRHCSEPCAVVLPDGRLFCVMRTMTGYVWYSISEDEGATWSQAEILRYNDTGEYVKNPLASCPLYAVDNKFLLIHYSNSYYADLVNAGKDVPAGMSVFTHRRPAFLTVGRYKAGARQPIWFSTPKMFLDNDGVIVSPKASNEIGTYGSITRFNGELVYWYPDRKYYLLGRVIGPEMLE